MIKITFQHFKILFRPPFFKKQLNYQLIFEYKFSAIYLIGLKLFLNILSVDVIYYD
jgi:hypothetical protein